MTSQIKSTDALLAMANHYDCRAGHCKILPHISEAGWHALIYNPHSLNILFKDKTLLDITCSKLKLVRPLKKRKELLEYSLKNIIKSSSSHRNNAKERGDFSANQDLLEILSQLSSVNFSNWLNNFLRSDEAKNFKTLVYSLTKELTLLILEIEETVAKKNSVLKILKSLRKILISQAPQYNIVKSVIYLTDSISRFEKKPPSKSFFQYLDESLGVIPNENVPETCESIIEFFGIFGEDDPLVKVKSKILLKIHLSKSFDYGPFQDEKDRIFHSALHSIPIELAIPTMEKAYSEGDFKPEEESLFFKQLLFFSTKAAEAKSCSVQLRCAEMLMQKVDNLSARYKDNNLGQSWSQAIKIAEILSPSVSLTLFETTKIQVAKGRKHSDRWTKFIISLIETSSEQDKILSQLRQLLKIEPADEKVLPRSRIWAEEIASKLSHMTLYRLFKPKSEARIAKLPSNFCVSILGGNGESFYNLFSSNKKEDKKAIDFLKSRAHYLLGVVSWDPDNLEALKGLGNILLSIKNTISTKADGHHDKFIDSEFIYELLPAWEIALTVFKPMFQRNSSPAHKASLKIAKSLTSGSQVNFILARLSLEETLLEKTNINKEDFPGSSRNLLFNPSKANLLAKSYFSTDIDQKLKIYDSLNALENSGLSALNVFLEETVSILKSEPAISSRTSLLFEAVIYLAEKDVSELTWPEEIMDELFSINSKIYLGLQVKLLDLIAKKSIEQASKILSSHWPLYENHILTYRLIVNNTFAKRALEKVIVEQNQE